MTANKRLLSTLLSDAVVLSLFLFAVPLSSRAQSIPPPADDAYLMETHTLNAGAASDSFAAAQPTIAEAAGPALPHPGTAAADDAWHLSVSPYLWFPGVHGSAAGPGGNSLSFRASPSDLLSNFRFGLMGGAEVRHKRLIVSMDMMWIRLEDDKAVPINEVGVTGAKIKATEFLLTPKMGIRLINQELIKIDALAGFRYWHLGESLNFNPSILGLNSSSSQNFVDPLVGGRIELAVSPKVVVNILGDVGGWGAGSQLEYQWAGLLGFRIKPALTLEVGYRYLNVDYSTSRGVVFKATTAGVLLGATLNLK